LTETAKHTWKFALFHTKATR